MKIENISLTALTLDTSANSEAFYIGHMALFAAQMVVTGAAPTGTFKVQVSCDAGAPNATTKTQQTLAVTNWFDVPSATSAITTTGTYGINVVDSGACWARVVWTSTSGTGSAAIRVNAKGV